MRNPLVPGRPARTSGGMEVVWRARCQLKPSPFNEKLYRALSEADPDIRKLARSISKKNVTHPLLITPDDYIISGHRRHFAAGLVKRYREGQALPCIVHDVEHGGPEFQEMLRESNLQREKTAEEKVREAIAALDPEEAVRGLERRRDETLRFGGRLEVREIGERKRRSRIGRRKQPMLAACLKVIHGEEWKKFWPLTDRQIHYALLNAPPLKDCDDPGSVYANDSQSYKNLTKLLTAARIEGLVPWHAIDDPTRPRAGVLGWPSPAAFVEQELDNFLQGYWRNLQLGQPNQVEIVGEKATLRNIIQEVAHEYCVPWTIGRGYSSVPPRYEMLQRFKRHGKGELVILFVSDFDPEGRDLARSFARSMKQDFGVKSMRLVQVALTRGQIEEHGLPESGRVKQKSSRAKEFVREHGEVAYELEAMPPTLLQQVLRGAIEECVDRKALEADREQERDDLRVIARLRAGAIEFFKSADEWSR